MQPPLRIAILETETPTPDIEQQYGTYGDCVIRLLQNAGSTLDPPLQPGDLAFTKWDVEKTEYYPDIDEIDAILISGCQDLVGANAFDSTPWILKLTDFVRKVLLEQDRVRVIGMCFGHQVVGRALGCVIDRNEKGWEVSVTTVSLSDIGKQVYGTDSFNIQQLHRDHLVTLPVNPFPQLPNEILEIIGETDTCAVQGVYTRRKVITVQGHPEYDEGLMKMLIDQRLTSGMFRPDFAKDATRRSALRNDGTAIAATFLKFLLDP